MLECSCCLRGTANIAGIVGKRPARGGLARAGLDGVAVMAGPTAEYPSDSLMNEPTDQNPSPLDPELLRELEAAEAGSGSSLLDDAPLLPAYHVDDDTPLAPVDPDFGVLPAGSQGSAPSDFLGGDDRAEEPAGASGSDQGMMDAGGVAAPMPTEVLDARSTPDQRAGHGAGACRRRYAPPGVRPRIRRPGAGGHGCGCGARPIRVVSRLSPRCRRAAGCART